MKRILSLVATAILVIAVLTAFSTTPEVEIGKTVPVFTLKGIDGKTHSLADYKGKIVVLEWSNPNCPFVQRVYGASIMQNLQKKYAGKVVWLTVNSTNPNHQDFESPEEIQGKYKEWGASFSEYLLDSEGTVGKMFDAKTTPHMFVINKDGKLVYAGGIDDDPRGSKSDRTNYVDAALTSLLAGSEIAVATSRSYGCSIKY